MGIPPLVVVNLGASRKTFTNTSRFCKKIFLLIAFELIADGQHIIRKTLLAQAHSDESSLVTILLVVSHV